MNHELKIWPQFYDRVKDGSKTFEIRNNDRGFQMGDSVTLREWDPERIVSSDPAPKGYTERPELTFKIGYIHVIDGQTVVFSLLAAASKKK